jgi:hypothetical protein
LTTIHVVRQKGYTIQQRIPQTFPCEKQEIVCLDISKSLFSGQEETTSTDPWAANAAVLHLDSQGTPIGISNHAAKETIKNTLLALRSLC